MITYCNRKLYDISRHSIRYWENQSHSYGWEIGCNVSFVTPTGQKLRKSFRDIGVNKQAALSNALRALQIWD